MTLIGPGDEVLIPDPYFVMYKYLTVMAGGTPVPYDTYPKFEITEEAIEKVVTPRCKVIIVNSPSNPTGHVAARHELEAVARVAERHNLIVISDEIYELFIYDNDRPHISVRTMYPHTLLMGGFSKSWGMPGWRLGWVNAPDAIAARMKTVQQFSFVCGPAPLQEGALAAMDVDMSPQIAEYRQKRDLVVETLSPHFELVPPNGTFYAFPKCPWGTDKEFVEAALDRECVIIHGSACSEHATHFRLSFAVDDATLKRGLGMLVDLAKNGA
jgi:aspartate aminotransferase/aminotransferase